ncbi:MAG TPA: alpha/beta fold hydrolase [Steroidobacteraceae bacterium]|nr:alpha/beta fold hydrolase [Steroidobacteraceae bacterium]
MASQFWRLLLGCQLLYAAAITAAIAASVSPTAVTVLLVALAAGASAPGVLAAGSYALSYAAGRGERAPATSGHRGLLRDRLRALLCESLAFGWATRVMIAEPYQRPQRAEPPTRASPARPVLLIHGIVCNRGVWRPLLPRLRALGFAPVRAVNLEPLRGDIEWYAASVVEELRRLQRESNGAPVAIVAHSMGGLVARAALRSVGPEVISRIVTIGSPHHGTVTARLFRSSAARQMRPDSPWLSALNAAQEGRLPVPVTSIYSLQDNLIAPARSAVLQGARLHELRGLGHLSLLRARGSLDRVLAALART